MTVERWGRISQIYSEAMACAPTARAAFLDDACAGDSALRAEVESLLQHELPSVAALDVMANEIVAVSPSAALGRRLGPYTIQALIGRGGMGQVYLAHDSELGRAVAIKVLPPMFALDPNRRARFDREARVLASLNHPHIAAIYGIAEGSGIRGLVLELVEGDTLADRLRARTSGAGSASGLPVKEALRAARQIAEALDAAHEKGIVHRDLKPANIKMTSDGTVKVLDFGLAKAASDHDEAGERSSPEGTPVRETRVGVVLGTVAYMSPEQAQGRRVDKRTDIWAFGCVLYEMLTGSSPFAGETAAHTIGMILERDPDWSAVPATTPTSVVALLHRCLEKDPRRRLRDIGEALISLENALVTPKPIMTAAAARDDRHFSMPVAVALASVVTGTMIWGLSPRPVPASTTVTRVAVPVSSDQRPAALRGLALSPDGRHLAYVSDQAGRNRLAVRAMDGAETQVLPDTEGAAYPFFSPDGKWIGFFTTVGLKKVPVNGGTVVTVLALSSAGNGNGGVWRSDDTIFFGAGRTIWRISAEGGSPDRVTALERSKGEIDHRLPFLLPDGQTLLYTLRYGPGWDEQHIVAQRLGTGDRHVLIKGAATARYAPTGHLIYTRAGTMMAVRFDASRLEVAGVPVALEENIREGVPYADYDVSSDGTLAYVQQKPEAYNRLPVVVDRKGLALPLPGVAPARYQNPRFSPDGRRVVLETTGSISDLWVYDVTRATLARLTTEGSSQFPVWSADGTRIAYRATRSGSRNLFWKILDGPAAEQRLTTGEGVQTPWSSSQDGTTLAFVETSTQTGNDIWILPLVGERTVRPFLREPFDETQPRLSPTGHWLAYVSDRSGRNEVYVQSYPDPRQWLQISTDGGRDPTWARSGRELFYRNGEKVMAVEIAEGPSFKPSQFLFAGDFVRGEPNIDFDVDPDGRRFLMIQSSNQEPPVTHINVVLNWFGELKRRLPVPQ